MGRHTRKKDKKLRKRLDKKKIVILVAIVLVALFILVKIAEMIFGGIISVSENVGNLITIVTGGGNNTDNVDKSKQFDLDDEESSQKKKKYVVYIDAGHGGNDKGYETKNGDTEKDIDLKISRLVSSKLSSQGDVSVVISRNSDTDLSNTERVQDGNDQNADVFISIHMTGNDDTTAQGVQTFYRVGATDSSNELASLVQKSIVAYVNLRDRGVTPFTFDVLSNNEMPAILIQCGFLSNPDDEKKLTNSSFQDKLAEGIAQGILSFLDSQS